MAMKVPALVEVARRFDAIRIDRQGRNAVQEPVAEEVPVALVYNGLSHAVMMATPADLTDFALGFSLTEGIVAAAGEIFDTEIVATDGGIEARMTIASERFATLRHRQRSLAGRTGCGLCGVDSIAEAMRPVSPVTSTLKLPASVVLRAMAELRDYQPINGLLGSVHGAAFAAADGAILVAREDVGRHNALDKLIGAIARAGHDGAQGFVIVTSRCSYEMVHKSAAAGIPVIAAVSAPTALAIDWATAANLTLVAFARGDRLTAYAGAERLT